MVLMVADEVRRVPYELLQVGYTLGATRREVIRHIIWPAALPGIFDALRLCNGWAWTYLVVAELVAANEGLGYRILKFSRFLQTPKIFVYLMLLGVIGLSLDLVFRAFNRARISLGDDRSAVSDGCRRPPDHRHREDLRHRDEDDAGALADDVRGGGRASSSRWSDPRAAGSRRSSTSSPASRTAAAAR